MLPVSVSINTGPGAVSAFVYDTLCAGRDWERGSAEGCETVRTGALIVSDVCFYCRWAGLIDGNRRITPF